MKTTDQIWKSGAVGKQYLEGVRGAIPLAAQQIELIRLIVGQAPRKVRRFMDLGCGDGILGRALFGRCPEARGVFLDFSETMIAADRDKLIASPSSRPRAHPNRFQRAVAADGVAGVLVAVGAEAILPVTEVLAQSPSQMS